MMYITQEQAAQLQNMEARQVITCNQDIWVAALIFPGNEVVILQGEARREGSPGSIEEVSIGVGYSCFEPLSAEKFEELVKEYSHENG